MNKSNGSIPAGQALKGKALAFNIKCNREIEVVGKQQVEFGSLLEAETEVGGKTFSLTGWLGSNGKTLPIVAEYIANPAMSKSGGKETPSLRLFAEVEGELVEAGVAFRKTSKATGKAFYTGFTNGTPKHDLTIYKHEPKAKANAEPEPEPELASDPE